MSESILLNSAISSGFLFQNSRKNLGPSYMTDLDFGDCFGRENPLSYSQRNEVYFDELKVCMLKFRLIFNTYIEN